jgi:Ser/Thr protein kinase RdoA (MazF antagonist)
VDNAGGGRRGLRATPTALVLAALRERYGIAGSRISDLGGSSSLNLLVGDDETRYVVRVYRPYVTAGRLAAIHEVRRALDRGGVPGPQVVTTGDGQAWVSVGGRLLEVERFVDHDGKMDSWDRLERGLPLLGLIHSLLHGIAVRAEGRAPMFANYVAPEQARVATARGTARIRSWQATPTEERLASMADELAALVAAGERDLVEALPRQLVHGDFWDNNVLFRGERVVLVADLDFMGGRARIDDLALTLHFADATFGHDEAEERRLVRLRRLMDAYASGLDHPLTALERAALPWAMARQPLWGIGGWVASLDDGQAARDHAAGMVAEVERALQIVRAIDRWQQAFA